MGNFIIGSLYENIKTYYYSVIKHDYDIPIILNLLSKYSQTNRSECRVLDVGCGYGKKLVALDIAGYQVLGVEANEQIVETNQKQGLNCINLVDFTQNNDLFDIIVMSHIIEHFQPLDLKNFIDNYLDRLKLGGHLIIATPLLTEYFYDDFDHVKPYSPLGIMMVFGKHASQVQYYSRNKLNLIDLKFRRRHFKFTFVRGKFLRIWTTKMYQILEFISTILCLMSWCWLGRKDGWVGIFKKI